MSFASKGQTNLHCGVRPGAGRPPISADITERFLKLVNPKVDNSGRVLRIGQATWYHHFHEFTLPDLALQQPHRRLSMKEKPKKHSDAVPSIEIQSADQVVRHVALLIESGKLRPGDRLAPERELAQELGVSRPTVRAGLHALAAMGVIESRQGAGTFINAGPPRLGAGPLSFLAALHGFTRDEIFEARKVLEVGAAGLAADRGLSEHLVQMSEEVTGMFATLSDPQAFLVHDVSFHRAVASAGGNPVLVALVEMISSLVYEQRRMTVEHAVDMKESAEMHRRIFQAIRDRDTERARAEMSRHLELARKAQASEELELPAGVLPSRVVGSTS
jgi:GntR family transcriptional repressor for pyruvate dehydrogenase complex